jgi:hypothetical protein
MPPEELVVVAIVFGSVVSIVFLAIVGGLIKTWIKSKNSPEDITKNKEFLSALRDFKEKTERRIANLEAIVVDEDHQLESNTRTKEKKSTKNKGEHSRAVEIELDDNERSEKSESSGSGNLRNMLNQ